jgi:ribosome-associated protein
VKLREEFIKLGQALKVADLVGSGADAKFIISDGLVMVNGEVETRRGRKLYDGDVIIYENNEIVIEK